MFHWLKRKPKNRRAAEREFHLDVKMRTGPSRAKRVRMLGIGLSAVFILTAVGLILWRGGHWLLDCLIFNNDTFAIRQIEVQDDGVLTAEMIRRWAMVEKGQNLMALDLMNVTRDLELQPPIEHAAVERVLPSTLRLIVNEREPVAQTIVTFGRPGGGLAQAVYDFDQDGYTMKPLDPRWTTWTKGQPPADEWLPILVGVQSGDVQLGRPVESAQIQAAVKLVLEFDHSPMAGMAELQRINVSVPEILQVTTSQGAEVTFSLSHFDTQLRRWRRIYDLYQKSGRAISSLDLSIANNLPVRTIAAASVPPVPPRAAKPTRTKRKHV